MTRTLAAQVLAARKVSTPLIGIQTVDPAAALKEIEPVLEGAPILAWDIMKGLRGYNKAGKECAQAISGKLSEGVSLQALTQNPSEALDLMRDLPQESAVFYQNAHRLIDNESVSQAIWNLRDCFKEDNRTLFLMAPSITLPSELAQDVLIIDEELPDDAALTVIAAQLHKDAAREMPEGEECKGVLSVLRGLGAFAAEQCLAMSMTKDGIDMDGLLMRKRQQVEQTQGLQFSYGGPTYSEIGGNEQLLDLFTKLASGPAPFSCIVFIDEIEKSVGGSSGAASDSSGVSQDQLGTMLKGYDDLKATGILLTGPPGTGKTAIARATGSQFGKPTIIADFGAAKGKFVGQSEQQARQIFKVIKAVAGDGGALFIATSNRLDDVPPELQRRLGKFGVWMVDLPSQAERESIWQICAKRWNIDVPQGDARPNDHDWTGADIANCCELSYKMACTPREAAGFLAPVAVTNPERIARIRAGEQPLPERVAPRLL